MSVRSTRLYGLIKSLEDIVNEIEDIFRAEQNEDVLDDVAYIMQLLSDAAADLRDVI